MTDNLDGGIPRPNPGHTSQTGSGADKPGDELADDLLPPERVPQYGVLQSQQSVQPPEAIEPQPPEPQSDTKRAVKKLNPIIAQTKLDLEACKQVVSRVLTGQEEKVKGQIHNRELEPAKRIEQVERYRDAAPCASTWDKSPGAGKFRACQGCQLFVYDFTNMSLSEAQELVFQREGKNQTSYWKRQDGKYLTSDCPVGAKRKRTIAMAMAAGLLLVIGAIATMILMPPAPPPPPTVEAGQPNKAPAKAATASPAQPGVQPQQPLDSTGQNPYAQGNVPGYTPPPGGQYPQAGYPQGTDQGAQGQYGQPGAGVQPDAQNPGAAPGGYTPPPVTQAPAQPSAPPVESPGAAPTAAVPAPDQSPPEAAPSAPPEQPQETPHVKNY